MRHLWKIPAGWKAGKHEAVRGWWQRAKKFLFKRKGQHREFLIPGHGVSLVPILALNGNVLIRAQCECGAYQSFLTPITLEEINLLTYTEEWHWG
jgi:hypothetical protein